MKKSLLPHAFESFYCRQLVIAALLLFPCVPAFAQLAEPNESNNIPWSNTHFVYEEQPASSVYVTPEAAAAMPAALVSDLSDVNDVTVWDNTAENHLLVMVVNTERRNLSAVVFDAEGNQVMLETPLDAGSYRMVEHTRDLKPGTYVLHVLENGKVIEQEKFVVK